MVTTYERALTSKERQSLEQGCVELEISTPIRALILFIGTVWYGALIAAIAGMIYAIATVVAAGPPIGLTLFITVLGGLFVLLLGWLLWATRPQFGGGRQAHRAHEEHVAAIIANGRARVTRVTADRVIVVNQFEDEGEAMIFAVGERQSLILHRQHVGPEDLDADWPAAEFEIVHAAYDNEELGIFAARGVLTPALEIDWTQFEDETVFTTLKVDETIVDLTPEEVIAGWGFDPSKESSIGDFLS